MLLYYRRGDLSMGLLYCGANTGRLAAEAGGGLGKCSQLNIEKIEGLLLS